MRYREELINHIRLEFSAVSQNEAFARCTVTSALSALDPTVDELADIRTAVSEAVTNSIIHGYRGSSGGMVTLILKIYADRRIFIRIHDDGCGIEDVERAMQPLYTGDPNGERGGMGFTIMKSFTDSLRVHSAPGRGTTVTMVKKLGTEKS